MNGTEHSPHSETPLREGKSAVAVLVGTEEVELKRPDVAVLVEFKLCEREDAPEECTLDDDWAATTEEKTRKRAVCIMK